MEAFSLKYAYLRCIGEQLQNALNDKGRLGSIYIGLTNYVLAKHCVAHNIPRITSYDCGNFIVTQIMYLFKTTAGIHLKSELPKFPLLPTPLERKCLEASINHLYLMHQLSIKLFKKLLLHHISYVTHLTLLKNTHLMSHTNFKQYYTPPTKLIKTTLQTVETLFCYPIYPPNCLNPCTIRRRRRRTPGLEGPGVNEVSFRTRPHHRVHRTLGVDTRAVHHTSPSHNTPPTTRHY
jgi:hypothetical protein